MHQPVNKEKIKQDIEFIDTQIKRLEKLPISLVRLQESAVQKTPYMMFYVASWSKMKLEYGELINNTKRFILAELERIKVKKIDQLNNL